MAPKASGQVIESMGQEGRTFAVRFRAYGQRHYLTLGTAEAGWTRRKAELELANVMADVRRGIWRPPEPEHAVSAPRPEPSFHGFASEWFDAHRRRASPHHAGRLPVAPGEPSAAVLRRHRLSEITVEEVDRYRHAKVREGELSAESINKTLGLLAQILEVAVEYGLPRAQPGARKAAAIEGSRGRRRSTSTGRTDHGSARRRRRARRAAERRGQPAVARSWRRWSSRGFGSAEALRASLAGCRPRRTAVSRSRDSKTDAGRPPGRRPPGAARRAGGL